MKSFIYEEQFAAQGRSAHLIANEDHKSLVTRFGDAVDVRNRGALRISRIVGAQHNRQESPAVVRLWTEEQVHELSAHKARALAAQLLAAAALTDQQNGH